MSVLDQFRDAEQRVAARLKELDRAIAEYREREEVARRLRIDPSATATPTAKRAGAVASPPAGRRSRRAARPGQRGEQLVDLVRTRPGITVREAATELGVDTTGLYRVVHRLEERGALRKHGRRLEAASGSAT
jgi:hypothetical protein